MPHRRERWWNHTCMFPLDAHIHSVRRVLYCFRLDIFAPFPPFVCLFLLLLAAVTSIHSSHSSLSSLATSEGGGYNQTRICVPIISGLGVSTQCCTGPPSSVRGVLTRAKDLKTAHLCSKRCRSRRDGADLHIVRLNLSGENGSVLCQWRRPEAITRGTFALSMDGCATTIVHEMQFLD